MMWAFWLALAAAQSSAKVAMAEADKLLAQERRENDAAFRKAAKDLGWEPLLAGQPVPASSQALQQQRQRIDHGQAPNITESNTSDLSSPTDALSDAPSDDPLDAVADLGGVPQLNVKTEKSDEEEVQDQKDHVVHLLSVDLHIIRKAQDSFERCLNQTDEAVEKVVQGGMQYGFASDTDTNAKSLLEEKENESHLMTELRTVIGAAQGDVKTIDPALASALELGVAAPARGGYIHDKDDHFLGVDRLVKDIATLREAHEAFAGCVEQSENVAAAVSKHSTLFADYVKLVNKVIQQKGDAAPRSLHELAAGLQLGTQALALAATKIRADAPADAPMTQPTDSRRGKEGRDRTDLAFVADGLSPASFLEVDPAEDGPAGRLRHDLALARGDVSDVRRAEHHMEAELRRITLEPEASLLHSHRYPASAPSAKGASSALPHGAKALLDSHKHSAGLHKHSARSKSELSRQKMHRARHRASRHRAGGHQAGAKEGHLRHPASGHAP